MIGYVDPEREDVFEAEEFYDGAHDNAEIARGEQQALASIEVVKVWFLTPLLTKHRWLVTDACEFFVAPGNCSEVGPEAASDALVGQATVPDPGHADAVEEGARAYQEEPRRPRGFQERFAHAGGSGGEGRAPGERTSAQYEEEEHR